MAALPVEVDHAEDLWTIVLDGELDSSTALVLRQSVGEIKVPARWTETRWGSSTRLTSENWSSSPREPGPSVS
jgi:hypothetical protein